MLPDTSDRRAAESQWAVETHGLTKRFGENVAVNGVELLVPRGCAFGYLGPNGAGKTTLIRVLLGLTHADAGTMSLLGYPVPRHRDAALARVGAIVDEPRFHSHLTGRQNLELLAAAREPAARDRIGPSLERVGMLHRADDRVSKYSMGMRQRLGVAACLIGDPELLILDEPMNGLDPAGMHDIRDMILSLVAEGRTVVLSSHLLDEVERTCDAVAIVDRGNVIRQGPISELLAGASLALQVECSEPDRARALLDGTTIGGHIEVGALGLGITLPAGTERDVIAEINRVLVEGRISVYRLQQIQASLESWFLPSRADWGARSDDCTDVGLPAPTPVPPPAPPGQSRDRRGSWIPTGRMITTRFMELRKRRGLMIALILVTIGIPTVFLIIRLLLPRLAPHSYGPAGGHDAYTGLVSGVLYVLRIHRRRHPGGHGGIRGSHRWDVPAPGGDGPLPPGALYGSDPRGTRHRRTAGGGGIHRRLRGVRVRRAHPARLQRRDRAPQPVRRELRELGRRPPGRGHLQLQQLQHRTELSDRPGRQQRPLWQRPQRPQRAAAVITKQPPGSQSPAHRRLPRPRSGKRPASSPR